jgi:hypothetical protein
MNNNRKGHRITKPHVKSALINSSVVSMLNSILRKWNKTFFGLSSQYAMPKMKKTMLHMIPVATPINK